MEGLKTFCMNWYFIFWILSILLAVGICGFIIDNNANVIETDMKKKELLEKSRDMNIIKTQFKDKTLALSGLEDKPTMLDSNGAPVNADAGAATGAEEDLNAPLNLKL